MITINSKEIISQKEMIILDKNKQFFSRDKKYIDAVLTIKNGESNISIRLLDWFVSNYSKEYNTCYQISINNIQSSFCVYNEYKNQLNGYNKKYFDPFCRGKKILCLYGDGLVNIEFTSSIGQLNFFKWAIRNGIIAYIQNNIEEIESDMKNRIKENRMAKSNK